MRLFLSSLLLILFFSLPLTLARSAAALQALQSDVDGIKCKLPNTVSVPYPQLQVYNPEVARAAAFGAAAGGYAGYGCGYGYNAGFWN